MRNKKLPYEYAVSISVVVESEDIEEVEDYADSLMDSIRSEKGISAADWYNITPIRKCRPKKTK